MKYYDVTFHELSGKSVVKRDIPSDQDSFSVWREACVDVTDNEIHLLVNGQAVILNRQYIVRIDCEEVEDPTEKAMSRKDELAGVITTLSNMGL